MICPQTCYDVDQFRSIFDRFLQLQSYFSVHSHVSSWHPIQPRMWLSKIFYRSNSVVVLSIFTISPRAHPQYFLAQSVVVFVNLVVNPWEGPSDFEILVTCTTPTVNLHLARTIGRVRFLEIGIVWCIIAINSNIDAIGVVIVIFLLGGIISTVIPLMPFVVCPIGLVERYVGTRLVSIP